MVGYPDSDTTIRLKVGQGLVGAAVANEQPLLVNDVSADPRYLGVVPDMVSAVVVPLLHKSRPLGALNILSRHRDQFTERDVAIVRQFAAHVSVALVNARLFERSRRDADAFETLAEIGREVASLLDLDQLFSRARAVDERRRRLPHLRDSAAQRLRRAGDEARRAIRREGHRAPGAARRGIGRLRRTAQGSGAGARRIPGSALHQAGAGRPVRVGDPDAPQGPLHRRRRSARARSSMRSASATSRSSRCWPARPPSRSRTPGCTKRSAPTRSGSRRKSASRSGCRSRSCPRDHRSV